MKFVAVPDLPGENGLKYYFKNKKSSYLKQHTLSDIVTNSD